MILCVFWCLKRKNELLEESLVDMELVDPGYVHLDLSYGGIKSQL